MEIESDTTLLERFVSARDENAFQGLVRRHAPIVRGAAMRCAWNAGMVEEICQQVFITLARKAARVPTGHLRGWLYKTAVLEARNARRKAARYAAALNDLSAHSPSTMHNTECPQEEASWEDIGPHLDDALLSLSEKARRSVILRFFDQLSISEIAESTGRSESACRKEIQRALERVSGVLRRRGVVTSAVSVGAVLAAQSLCAPTASAASVSALASSALQASGVLSGPASASLFLYSMTASQIIKTGAAVVILSALPVAYFWNQNAALREEVRRLRSPSVAVAEAAAPVRVKLTDSPLGSRPDTAKPSDTAPSATPADKPAGFGGALAEMIALNAEKEAVKNAESELEKIRLMLPDLTPAQEQAIRERLTATNKTNAETLVKLMRAGVLEKMMNDPSSMTAEEMETLAKLDPVKYGDGIQGPTAISDLLTGEQSAAYTAKIAERRVTEAEDAASENLKKITKVLDLDSAQADAIFQALAAQQLAPPGSAERGSRNPFDLKAMEAAKEQIVKDHLTPEQAALYDRAREEEKRGLEEFLKKAAQNSESKK